MINLSQLEPFTTTAQTIGNLILITPNTNIGIVPQKLGNQNSANFSPFNFSTAYKDSFLFNYNGDEIIQLVSEITDHYIEDNTTIQDQISLKPIEITLNGYIGELNDVVPEILAPLKFAAEKLTVVSAFTPQLSQTAIIAYNEAVFIYNTAINLANSAVQSFTSLSGGNLRQNKQQEAFTKFYGWWIERRLFTVQTPWAIFKDMAIKNLKVNQSAEDRTVSAFEITFKKMKFSSTLTINADGTVGKVQETRFSTANSQAVQLPATKPATSTPLGELL